MEQNVVFTASFTRPNNTTTYAAEDAVNNGTNRISFSPIDGITLNSGKSIIVKTVRIVTDSTTTTNASFRLMFTDKEQTVIADNLPQTLLFTNKDKRCGWADLTLSTGGTGSDCAEGFAADVNVVVKTQEATFTADLIAKAAYVPTANQNFYIELACIVLG